MLVMAMSASSVSCGSVVQSQVRRLARKNPQVLYRIATRIPAVALTIDDGPDPQTTPGILDVLQRHGARATFFIITSRVPGNEEVLRRIVRENHELGNHMFRDEPSIKLSAEEFERQLLESHALLSGFAPIRWFRPGSGRFDSRMLATLERHDYACALGSAYPFDPQIRWSWFSRRFILSNVRPGAIIILHDWGGRGRRTVKTLSALLPALAKRGFRVLTLTELATMSEAATSPPAQP